MRIVDIRDIVAPIRSNIANAYIDFSQMTASVVAIETDLRIEGKPVIVTGIFAPTALDAKVAAALDVSSVTRSPVKKPTRDALDASKLAFAV